MQYTIGEKIAYYQKKLLQKDLSERQRNEIKQRLQSLYRMKRKYGVVYMEDERFFRKPSRDGHHYIVSDIDSKENISAHRVTHHARGNEPLTGFDGKSRLQRQLLTHDRRNNRLNANDAYVSVYSDKVDSEDISLIEKLRRRK